MVNFKDLFCFKRYVGQYFPLSSFLMILGVSVQCNSSSVNFTWLCQNKVENDSSTSLFTYSW